MNLREQIQTTSSLGELEMLQLLVALDQPFMKKKTVKRLTKAILRKRKELTAR